MRQKFFDSINIAKQCKKYGLTLWQCPQFLFLVLGAVVISSSLATYFIGSQFSENPEIVVLIVLAVAAVLIIIGFIITQSFERLAQVARMKSEFIGIVSHQLRAPLANLRWTIDLLCSGRIEHIPEKELDYLRILQENSQRMEELVSDLLIVSRLEDNESPLKKEAISLLDLVKSAISRFEPLARASNVELRLSVKEPVPNAFADPSQVQQVIDNLLDNAVRYIKSRGLVEINLSQKDNLVRLEIKDSGIGIASRDQKYIFQKFFRGENAFHYQSLGSGLGLYIAKAIIERHGGKIGFVSKEEAGSVFWFTLPIK